MEIGQFIWSSQTVLTERDEWLRGRSILNVKAKEFPPRQIFVSVVRRLTRSQVDVGHVVSNSSTRCRGRWYEFNPSLKDIALWQLPTKKNMKSRKCGKFILTCVVLLGWLKKHVEGNISREIWRCEDEQGKCILHLCYCYCYCFSHALPCYNQSRHQLFRQWVTMRGYVHFFH